MRDESNLFRNDYSFGAHPKVLEAVCASTWRATTATATTGTRPGQGAHPGGVRLPRRMVEFLIGGTQTNVVACSFLLKPWEAAICPDSGHLNGHEVGAFEATGHKILPVPVGGDGKITPEMLPPCWPSTRTPI